MANRRTESSTSIRVQSRISPAFFDLRTKIVEPEDVMVNSTP
jgi:hypothetical protein